MAGSPSNTPHHNNGNDTTQVRAQRVPQQGRNSLHHDLRRRPSLPRRSQQIIAKLFSDLQQHLLLRPTGVLTPGSTVSFLGRKVTHNGDSIDIALSEDYINNILEESNMVNCNPAATPGTTALKTINIEDDAPLDQQQHARYRRLVGKIQWLSYTRPDISFAPKELARALQQPTANDDKKLKRLIRYLKGTAAWKHSLRPTIRLNNHDKMPLDIEVYTDANWASWETTRKSTTGFSIHFLGANIRFGSRTQATVALSSAEPELYAMGTAATEALHIRNFLSEAFTTREINIRIHTDSSSAKSIAIRQGYITAEVLNRHLYRVGLPGHPTARL